MIVNVCILYNVFESSAKGLNVKFNENFYLSLFSLVSFGLSSSSLAILNALSGDDEESYKVMFSYLLLLFYLKF
jgi:hypothetical protein